jgi:Mor family transcriptional regulator
VAKRRRQLRKDAADRKPYVPEPTASVLGVQFSEPYDKPYLKDFVKKRRTNIQKEMTCRMQNKSFYLPANPKSAKSQTQRNSKITNCKV